MTLESIVVTAATTLGSLLFGAGLTIGFVKASLKGLREELDEHIKGDIERWRNQDARDGKQNGTLDHLTDRGFRIVFSDHCKDLRAACRTEWKEDINELKVEMRNEFKKVNEGLERNRSEMFLVLREMASDVERKRIAREQGVQ